MDDFLCYILLAQCALSLGMIAIALCLFVPRAIYHYNTWQHRKKTIDFSGFIVFSFAAFSMFSTVYLASIRATLQLERYVTYGYERTVIFLILVFLLVYVLIPNTLVLFQKWRNQKKTHYFSLFIFLFFVCFYVMSILYLFSIPTAFR